MSSTEDLEKGGNGHAPRPHAEHGHEHGHEHHHEHEHGDHHIHIPHHPGKRLKQWARADGRKIHIAHTPEEEVKLRHYLSVSEPSQDFDIYIHGSPEHLDAIRELHAHHEQRRDDLRDRHGEIYDEFEHVRMELDALNTELHMLTEHGVALEASFSKFGYSAHLRTKDSPDSSSTSLNGDHSFSHETHDWDEERKHGQQLVFWKRPVVRQYFHKGLLWRASSKEEVGSFELFIDLLYVGIIGVVGDVAAEHATGDAFLKFSIVFIIGWKIWSDLTLIVSWFETDDIFQRLAVMFVMICLFGYTTNIAYAFEDSPEETYTSLIAFFLTQRLFAGSYLLWVSYLIPMVRGTMWATCFLICLSSALWITSIHVSLPNRYAVIWLAIPLDLVGHVPITLIMRTAQKSSNSGFIIKHLAKYFEFYPAVNIEHKTERTNAFVTLVFGYSVLAIIYQSHSAFGINAFFGKATLGLIQAFAFNWIYFEIDGFNLHVHAIRRHFLSAFVWISAHLPFIMGYVLAAATMSRLVLAHDCRDANVEDLGESFVPKSEEELSDGLRWFYCGGLGVALACMSLISLSHVHKKIPNQRLPKRPRMIFRFCISIIIVCLPLAKSFTSLSLMGTTCGLVVVVLSTDLYGNSCTGTSFFEGAFGCKQRGRYTYNAECKIRRRMLREKAKRGEKVTLDELISGDTNEKAKGVELLQ